MKEYPFFKTGEGLTPVDGSEAPTTQENQQDRKFSITSAFSKVKFISTNSMSVI